MLARQGWSQQHAAETRCSLPAAAGLPFLGKVQSLESLGPVLVSRSSLQWSS